MKWVSLRINVILGVKWMVVGGLDVVEVGRGRAINIVLMVDLNGVLKRREVKVRTVEMECF